MYLPWGGESCAFVRRFVSCFIFIPLRMNFSIHGVICSRRAQRRRPPSKSLVQTHQKRFASSKAYSPSPKNESRLHFVTKTHICEQVRQLFPRKSQRPFCVSLFSLHSLHFPLPRSSILQSHFLSCKSAERHSNQRCPLCLFGPAKTC